MSACVEAIPDLTPLLKPTTLGDFATYFLASAGGLFLGGELGKIIDRMMLDWIVLIVSCRLCWWCGERDVEHRLGSREQEEN